MSLKRRRKSAEPPLAGLRTDHGMHWAIWRRLASFGIASLARQRGPARMLAIEAPPAAVLSGLRAAADEHRHQGGGITSDAGTCYGSIRSAGGRRAVACVV